MWNSDGAHILWQIDSEWSDKRVNFVSYGEFVGRVLALYKRDLNERLSRDEYTWLAEHGFVKTNGDYDGQFKVSWQIVILENKEIQTKLIAIGDRIKERYKCEFDALRKEYTAAVLKSVLAHLQKVKRYELQFIFHSDGWFLLHCIKTLLESGKLKMPTERQRMSLTTMIINA